MSDIEAAVYRYENSCYEDSPAGFAKLRYDRTILIEHAIALRKLVAELHSDIEHQFDTESTLRKLFEAYGLGETT